MKETMLGYFPNKVPVSNPHIFDVLSNRGALLVNNRLSEISVVANYITKTFKTFEYL